MLKITYRLSPAQFKTTRPTSRLGPRPVRVQIQIQIIHMVTDTDSYCCTRSSLVATQLGKLQIRSMQCRTVLKPERTTCRAGCHNTSLGASRTGFVQVVTHKKDRQEIRQCINPKDLNTALKDPHLPMRKHRASSIPRLLVGQQYFLCWTQRTLSDKYVLTAILL